MRAALHRTIPEWDYRPSGNQEDMRSGKDRHTY